MRKILGFILAAFMVASLLPASVMAEGEPINIAREASVIPSYYGELNTNYPLKNAFDGDATNFTQVKTTGDVKPWIMLDLRVPCQLTKIKAVSRTNGEDAIYLVNIEVANKADFSDKVVLKQDSGAYRSGEALEYDVTTTEKYRYVRINSRTVRILSMSEFEVWGYYSEPTNMARNSRTVASYYGEQYNAASYPYTNGNNGNTSDFVYFKSTTDIPYPIYTLDLGMPSQITNIKITSRNNSDAVYKVNIEAANKADFTDAVLLKYDANAYRNGEVLNLAVNATDDYRYVRVRSGDSRALIFAEFEVWGHYNEPKNLVRNAVTAVKGYGTHHSASYTDENGNDGNANTAVLLKPSDDVSLPWYMIDLCVPYQISEIKIKSRNSTEDPIYMAKIEASNSPDFPAGGTTVLYAASGTAYRSGDVLQFNVADENNYRYIRIANTASGRNLSFAEFEVYGYLNSNQTNKDELSDKLGCYAAPVEIVKNADGSITAKTVIASEIDTKVNFPFVVLAAYNKEGEVLKIVGTKLVNQSAVVLRKSEPVVVNATIASELLQDKEYNFAKAMFFENMKTLAPVRSSEGMEIGAN